MRHSMGIVSFFLVLLPVAADDPSTDLKQARSLLQSGKYAEAGESYESIAQAAKDDPATRAAAALGRARSLASVGESAAARKALEEAQASLPAPNADLLAELASLQFSRGEWDDADRLAKEAIAAQKEHPLAHWIVAELLDARGKRADAIPAWKWFIDYFNAHDDLVRKNADELILVGRASEKYYRATARGEDLASSLNDVLNELYEPAIVLDPECWQAAWLQGRLFLAGYREGDAKKELTRALTINPNSAEVLVTLGQSDLDGYALSDGRKKATDALEINPEYVPAHVLLADLNISDERFADARASAEKAVELNPRSEDALARLAASRRLLVEPEALVELEKRVLDQNPRPVAYYSAVGERLADRRKYKHAEEAFQKAIQADPENAAAKIGLGMLYMQIGREKEAGELFTTAFAADPFNIRADNMMKVLEHMKTYESIDTDHYSVIVDPSQDKLLGQYMSKYLEGLHGSLTDRFGFSPPERTKIEIMKNHQWFSGRTTALPFIPTVGACTGTVVALSSPRTTKQPFNWARVMTHEVAHVITLQQTEFNIPHWYTEALAVEAEGKVRPQEWNKLLMERIPARKLLNLETINLGFIRPSEPDERQMAYCQAQLYAQYMVKRFGPDSIFKMLDAYRRGLTTPKAVPDAFGVPVEDFEKGYLDFLDDLLKTIRARVDDEEPVSFSRLLLQARDKPDDPTLNARVAYEYFARRDYKAARPYADKALDLNPREPLAAYVKARLHQVIGDEDAALAVLEPALDREKPNERVLDLLAELVMKAGRLDDAEALYELGRRDDPLHTKWIAGLARVHLRQGNEDAFLADLSQLAANDADDLDVRRALAERHLQRQDFAEAKRWATDCLYIQVYDPTDHVLLADSLSGLSDHAEAVSEYRTALTLEPDEPAPIQAKLSSSLLSLGQKDEAKAAAQAALKDDPDNETAKRVMEALEKPAP